MTGPTIEPEVPTTERRDAASRDVGASVSAALLPPRSGPVRRPRQLAASEADAFFAVVSHGLLNDLTAIHGFLAQARAQLEPNTAGNDLACTLLQLGEQRVNTTVATLRHWVLGHSLPRPTGAMRQGTSPSESLS